MGKTLILNLSDVNLKGDILDIGESYGVIYNMSKDIQEELSIDVIDENNKALLNEQYDTCTVFFCLSSIGLELNRNRLIKDIARFIKPGGEIYIWDIRKEVGKVCSNQIRAVLPSGKIKEFEFKNLNIVSKSNIEDTKKRLQNIFEIKEEKLWEDMFFIKAEKI